MREMYMLALTNMEGGRMYVRAHAISGLQSVVDVAYGKVTLIHVGTGFDLMVKETDEQIKNLLKGSLGLWRDVVII